MNKRPIVALALMAALAAGGALSAHAGPAGASNQRHAKTEPDADCAAAMETYQRQLADYRRDMAAYEADPGTWTTEIPHEPAKPEKSGTITRKQPNN